MLIGFLIPLAILFSRVLMFFYDRHTCQWMFGYGSNMDISHVKYKKELKVYGKMFLIFLYMELMNIRPSI